MPSVIREARVEAHRVHVNLKLVVVAINDVLSTDLTREQITARLTPVSKALYDAAEEVQDLGNRLEKLLP